MRAPYKICQGFSKSGWDVEILTIRSSKNESLNSVWGIIPVRKITGPSRRARIFNLALHLLKPRRKTTVISSVWDWHNFSLMLSKLLWRNSYVIALDGYAHRATWHGTDFLTQLWLELRYGLIIRNADIILAESPDAFQQIKNFYPSSKVYLIPFCLWQEELASIEYRWQLQNFVDDRSSTIFYCGRFIERKGLHHLIDAFASLAPKYPQWNLELAGPITDNEYYQRLQQLIKKYSLEDRIRFIPPLHGEALYRKYRQSSIFCLPSYGEGMPTAVTEAMYFGGAIIAGKSGAVPFQINNCGLLFDYGDTQQLKIHLEALMSSESLRDKFISCARTRAIRLFMWEKYFDELELAFRNLIPQAL